MNRLSWDDLRQFLEVIHSGSVTRAAERQGISHTTVSRRISALEQQLGKILFERANSGWVITPVGERIAAYAESMAENAVNIERQVLADSHELRGLLRVTAPDHTERLVLPVVREYMSQYPEVDIELMATTDELNLAVREADVALRGTDHPPPNVVGKRIARIGFSVYGTAALKKQVEANPNANDIPCITWIGDGHTLPLWIEKNFPRTQRICRTTSIPLMLAMIREGIGIARIGCLLGDPDPQLHRIQTHYVEPGPELWVLSHVDLRTTARVRIFRDLLVGELTKQKDLIEGKLQL